MRVACFIPIKANSKRVNNKNIRFLGNKRLFQRTLDIIKESNVFDDVFVDTDSELVKEYCQSNNINVIDRLPRLSEDTANGNDLLEYWISREPDYDIYFQIHVTCPFISLTTVKKCVMMFNESKIYDSVFTAVKDYTWFWFDGKPVNYDPKELPRSQDARPLVRETTCLYGIKKDEFLLNKSRIGRNPMIYYVDQKEAIDIDEEIDFEYAKLIAEKEQSSARY